MSVAGESESHWVRAWIDGQKVALEQWHRHSAQQATPSGAGSLAEQFAAAAASVHDAFSGFGVAAQMASLWWPPRPTSPGGSTGPWEMPGLGPLREQQAAAQELASAIAELDRILAEMAGVMATVHADALDLLSRRAAEQANGGKPVENLKALYDLWIECGEATYAKVAHGQAFCRLQAELANARVKVQEQQQLQIERWLKQLDLPTRSEVNTLNRRIRELQRLAESAARGSSAPAARPTAKGKSAAQKPARKSAATVRARTARTRPARKPRAQS